MVIINVNVAGTSIKAAANEKLTSGMVGIQVVIEYDETWDGLTKTAFFRVGNQTRKRDFVDKFTSVPWEVMRHHGKPLEIGVAGMDGTGSVVIPTVWAVVGNIYEGASGEISGAPTPDADDNPSAGGGGASINDNLISATTTWSSQKIDSIIGDIDSALDAIIEIQNELMGGDDS